MASTPLLDQLRGGDRRSIGRSNAVVRQVLKNARRVPELAAGLWHRDPLIRMRAGDALEKVSREQPGWLSPMQGELLELARVTEEQEARWHLAQILPRLGLRGTQRASVVTVLRHYRQDRSAIVRVCALEALAELAASDSTLRRTVGRELQTALERGSAAERARARKLIAGGAA